MDGTFQRARTPKGTRHAPPTLLSNGCAAAGMTGATPRVADRGCCAPTGYGDRCTALRQTLPNHRDSVSRAQLGRSGVRYVITFLTCVKRQAVFIRLQRLAALHGGPLRASEWSPGSPKCVSTWPTGCRGRGYSPCHDTRGHGADGSVQLGVGMIRPRPRLYRESRAGTPVGEVLVRLKPRLCDVRARGSVGWTSAMQPTGGGVGFGGQRSRLST